MTRRDDEVTRARTAIEAAGLVWYQPHVTGGEDEEDEVGLEWWNQGRYLSWSARTTEESAGWSVSYFAAPRQEAVLVGDCPRDEPERATAGLVEAYRRLVA